MRNCWYWGAEKCESFIPGMKCIDLCNDTIKITGIHIPYNKKKRNEKKFLESVTKIYNLLKVWRMHRLTLEGKIIVFECLVISKNLFSFH